MFEEPSQDKENRMKKWWRWQQVTIFMSNSLITDGGKTGFWGVQGTTDFVILPKVGSTYFYPYFYFF
jgi:hypothetical protein